jgi:Na+/H+ antiporter NhaB
MSDEIKSKENLHIIFWLLKDFCWALEIKPVGMLMIIPTVSLAFYIAYKTRNHLSDFIHNLAVCCWICANATWMLGEFFDREMRVAAGILFASGVSIILVYHLREFVKKRRLTESDSKAPR